VFLGATMSVETTAAAAGEVGKLRFDPMAMLPFCGYNMADYFGHWLAMARKHPNDMPRIFLVNWFRKDENGKFIWPGYGENSRVLQWIFRRCDGEADADQVRAQLPQVEEHLARFGDRLPDEVRAQFQALKQRLG
jgi:phosphoenolpyruvate carboxykinase (GTP)